MPYVDRQKQLLYQKKWNRKNYLENKATERQRIIKRKEQISKWFEEYKKSLSCTCSKEESTVCLEFHHIDSSTKDFNLASVSSWGYGKKRILAEIAKCMVLCANCHRKVHAGILKISETNITRSSNGRTMDSDSINLGSNPSLVTSTRNPKVTGIPKKSERLVTKIQTVKYE